MKKNKKNNEKRIKKGLNLILPFEIKKYILGIIPWLLAIILILSLFEKAGLIGRIFKPIFFSLLGQSFFFLPLILILAGLVIFFTKYKNFLGTVFLAAFLLILGISGLWESLRPGLKEGGYLGYLATPLVELFGFWITGIIFGVFIIIGILIFWKLLTPAFLKEAEKKPEIEKELSKIPLLTRIFKRSEPTFKVKEVEPALISKEAKLVEKSTLGKPESGPTLPEKAGQEYQTPPLELLEAEKGTPLVGDIRQNSAIIKKTLLNFDIPVEMSEVNIGPTVTQYTLKPAEGVKLSKITALSNDLALALAAHPIRIEAPIPGKSLVGIEVPNKMRTRVRLRDLLSEPNFQKTFSSLAFVLGRDVSGNPVFADLFRMPHLLVAGSTGTGKTIFLNSLILSFLYRNSPQILRFILIDPKRVEFPVYNELPHLLCPVIYDAQKAVASLKWLIEEMERRFEILAREKARDITSFNEIMMKKNEELMPYIVLIIDELADLMAAKGREIEAGIVRLAQLARAVGIHLVVATQRPSVEVITGLIKANITSRVTFQVASQVDSRTVLDMAGAEKLLGLGDMLFVSAEITKPKRIQGSFVSEKEVRRVVNYIKTQNSKLQTQKLEEELLKNELAEDLEKSLESPETELESFYTGEDPLYEEAKRVVREAKKASASLLQRRLRIGYARAARLIDMLEERGVVGPGEGAKPREILMKNEEEEWKKV